MAIEKTIVLNVDSKKAEKGLKNVDKNAKDIGKNTKKSGAAMSAAFNGVGKSIGGVIPMFNTLRMAIMSTGVGALVVAIGGLVGLFASAANKGAEFQKSLSTLKAIASPTTDELTSLSTQARELGASTQYTAIEVVGLQTELAKLGFTAGDIKNSTPAILDLASSLEVDLASAAEFAGSVVRSFGLTTEETQRVVDVMSLSTSASALNFSALQESLKVVAPASRATGVSVERTAAYLGILANNGLKGSVAGTGLAKTFIELNKKGISLEDGMNKVRNSSNKLNTAIELVGVVGAKSFLSLAESGAEINQLEKDFLGAEGAAKRMAEVRLDNLGGDMTKLSSAWEGFLLEVEDGDGILNKLQRVTIQGLTTVVSGLGTAIDFVAFIFRDSWDYIKENTTAGVELASGLFKVFGANIKIFGYGVMSTIAEIPIIGKGLDKKAIQKNIEDAKNQLVNGQKLINDGVQRFKERAVANDNWKERFNAEQLAKTKRIETLKQAKIDKALLDADIEGQDEATEEQINKAKEAAKKKAEILEKIRLGEINGEDERRAEELRKIQKNYENLIAEAKKYGKDTSALKEAQLANEQELRDKFKAQDKAKSDAAEEKRKSEEKTRQEEKIKELELNKEFESLNFEEQRVVLAEREALLLEDKTLNEEQQNSLKKQYSDARIKIDELEAQAKEKMVAAIGQTLATASTLLGKNTVAGKAMAVAATTVDTLQASMSAFKGMVAVIPGPAGIVAGSVAAAGAIATGFATIKKIVSVKVPGGGGGVAAPSMSASGGGGGSSPSPQFNVVGNNSANQLAQTLGSQQPIKTYVTASDVSTQQSLDRNIIQNASLG
jgi:hypothetical protein